MFRYGFFICAAALLAGCAALQMGWYKPGATQSGFAEDKYECMQGSQERVSGAYVNAYGGAASSSTTTNIPLFQACMEARGYVWTSRAQVDKEEGSPADEPQPPEQSSPAEQSPSDDTGNGFEASPAESDACRKLDSLNKGYAAGTVTREQFDAQFQALMKACDGVT
jgi:hypothetical protein